MSSNNLPSAKERRRMLGEGSASIKQAGLALLAVGRWAEAQECLEAAGQLRELAPLAERALEAGDFFAWRQALWAMGQEPEHTKLAQLAERAAVTGKNAYAVAAQAMLKLQG